MLRLLVVAEDRAQESEMVDRARAVAAEMPEDHVEIVVVPLVDVGTDRMGLDVGLFLMPPADDLIVVGRSSACTVEALGFLVSVLAERDDLMAVTTGGDLGPDVGAIVDLGGAFRVEPVCQVGGFGTTGNLSVHDRLAVEGFLTAVLPPPRTRPVADDGPGALGA